MKSLHRESVRLVLACLTFALISPNLSHTASAQQQSPRAAGQTATAPATRPDSDAVVLAVTVKDKKGNFIGGLRQHDFAVYDNKVPQEISYFAAQDEPISVGVIIDVSPSVADFDRGQLRAAGDALLRFAELGHPANEYFLIGFAARPLVLADWTRGGAAFREKLSELKTVDRVGRSSALFDACYLGI
jgi:VWFA-related protein